MTVDNFILQGVGNDDPHGSITVSGSGSPRKAGMACEARNGVIESDQLHAYDGFLLDPAIQRATYKNTDRVIPYSIHNLFLIKYR